jgi:hypothetical protein
MAKEKRYQGNRKCQIMVTASQYGDLGKFPLNAGGWSAAKKAALEHTKRTQRMSFVDLRCPSRKYKEASTDREQNSRGMALYQCNQYPSGVDCVIESIGSPDHANEYTDLAGLPRRRARKRRR